jgi:S-adenosylmethionine-diacylgycerolhomoserine-N-methlytransferase
MNEIYRHQRHIYDFTRKYYLLGRDQLIDRLNPGAADRVLEIGCGTGRNLILAARHFPNARFFGIDVSSEMLASTNEAIARSGLSSRVQVARADAADFDPAKRFRQGQFDRVVLSYTLSMIPEWRNVLRSAYAALARNGEMHIVDFGRQDGLPAWFGVGLRRWLARFGVVPCDDLESELLTLTSRNDAALHFERPYRGYVQYAIVGRPG